MRYLSQLLVFVCSIYLQYPFCRSEMHLELEYYCCILFTALFILLSPWFFAHSWYLCSLFLLYSASNDSNIEFTSTFKIQMVSVQQNHRLLKWRRWDLNGFEQRIADIGSAFESLMVTSLTILFDCWKRCVLAVKSICLAHRLATEMHSPNNDIYYSCRQSVR